MRALQHCKKLQKKIQNYRNPNKKTHKKESITKNSHFFSKMYPPIGRKKNLRRAWSACAQWQGVRVRRALYIKKSHSWKRERKEAKTRLENFSKLAFIIFFWIKKRAKNTKVFLTSFSFLMIFSLLETSTLPL